MYHLPPHGRALPHRERGVVLIGTLLALVLLMLAAFAMLRLSDTSVVLAGNLAFQRDLTNQAERAFSKARTVLASGELSTETKRQADQPSLNYSASRLATSANGIPKVLVSNDAYEEARLTAPELGDNGVTVRYVIDRLCLASGEFSDASCEVTSSGTDKGGSSWLHKPGAEKRPVYRVSVRVTGPRSTQAFFQSTFAL
jgi:type IV pilus assembly protein PilX